MVDRVVRVQGSGFRSWSNGVVRVQGSGIGGME